MNKYIQKHPYLIVFGLTALHYLNKNFQCHLMYTLKILAD